MIIKAYIQHCYWSLKLNTFHTKKDFKAVIQAIATQFDPNDIKQNPGQTLSSHLQQAKKQLREACQEAKRLCKAHLKAILNQALAAKQHKKSQALKYLAYLSRMQLTLLHPLLPPYKT